MSRIVSRRAVGLVTCICMGGVVIAAVGILPAKGNTPSDSATHKQLQTVVEEALDANVLSAATAVSSGPEQATVLDQGSAEVPESLGLTLPSAVEDSVDPRGDASNRLVWVGFQEPSSGGPSARGTGCGGVGLGCRRPRRCRRPVRRW